MLNVAQVRLRGMLLAYAKQELSFMEMEQVSALLAHDLELGEELERIFIALEESGQI